LKKITDALRVKYDLVKVKFEPRQSWRILLKDMTDLTNLMTHMTDMTVDLTHMTA
jgi:hypothetical protein